MPRKMQGNELPPDHRWRDGFVAPKGVAVADARAAVVELDEPSPEELYEASKDNSHVLHEDIWSEGDQEWARRGRIERCRKILGAIVEIVRVGNREIEVRSVEFVGKWALIEEIISDVDLRDRYFLEIQRLNEQAMAKLARCRELMRSE